MLAFFHYDLTLNVIPAILTITGYSVNDTILVFDRVREDQVIDWIFDHAKVAEQRLSFDEAMKR